MPKKTLALIVMAIFLAVSMTAMAGSKGKIKVKLVNHLGATTNGTVIAKKGNTTKTCKTSAGTCTLTGLKKGKWTVTAKTSGGAKGGPVKKRVKAGKKVNLTIKVKRGRR